MLHLAVPYTQVWDLRARKVLYTIPAHRSLISSCRYERATGTGQYIVTGGYDCLIKVGPGWGSNTMCVWEEACAERCWALPPLPAFLIGFGFGW
jgi:hypothetical protein